MATLKEQQIAGLVEAKIGMELKDKERAMRGISQYIDIGILLIDLEVLMDRAEAEDIFTPQYEEDEDWKNEEN